MPFSRSIRWYCVIQHHAPAGMNLVAISVPTKLSLLSQGAGGLTIMPRNVMLLKATRITKRKYFSEILIDNLAFKGQTFLLKDKSNRPAMIYVRTINW
jgi:hypothetical protein